MEKQLLFASHDYNNNMVKKSEAYDLPLTVIKTGVKQFSRDELSSGFGISIYSVNRIKINNKWIDGISFDMEDFELLEIGSVCQFIKSIYEMSKNKTVINALINYAAQFLSDRISKSIDFDGKYTEKYSKEELGYAVNDCRSAIERFVGANN